MVFTVRVSNKFGIDPKGEELLAEIKRTLLINSIKHVKTTKIYTLEGINKNNLKKFIEKALCEKIDHEYFVEKKQTSNNSIHVTYKPGVMNPEVASILKAASDMGIKLEAVDSSWEYSFSPNPTKKDLEKIIDSLLVNKIIEEVQKKKLKTLKIAGTTPKTKTVPIRELTEDRLMDLSKDKLFLNMEEMKIIQNYFQKINRDPTDCEVEVLAQSWSEHCVHKTFKANLVVNGKKKKPLFERIKQTAKYNKKLIVSAFDDNSGVIDFYDGWAINGKVETHNSPSAIEPYGGAMTGSGGVFRDILGTGKGAKPIISTDVFCFAPPTEKNIPPGCLPPDYLLRRVVAGVRDYGNRVGIPTNNGSIHFHRDFRAKPTVAVGSFGLLKKSQAKKGKPKQGDLIITIGGRTGRDGIHGATFSSGEMTGKTLEISGSAVQIGNAIEEKRVIDAILEMNKNDLIRAITDCGAGGFSSAIGEMAQDTGAQVHLEKVPTKYPGLAPWEIFLSESQERMVLAIEPKNFKKIEKTAALYNVEVASIGKFTNTKKLIVLWKKETVCNLNMQFLHNGLPQRTMIATRTKKSFKEKLPKKPKDFEQILKKILSDPNIASKESIVRLYDHNVQGKVALYPYSGMEMDSPNDGSAITPILGKNYGLVVAHGLNPILNKLDPYAGSVWAITEAVSNFVAIGGDIKNAALIDNFIWPFPDEESLYDLDRSVDACNKMAQTLKMPFVSGKDSLSSTYRFPNGDFLKIPPVLLISVFGKIADVKKTVTADFKRENSTIVLVGESDNQNLGGSIYYEKTGAQSSNVPKVSTINLTKVFNKITSGIKNNKILSVHDISEGGLAVALCEMSFGGGLGATIDVSKINGIREDFKLFSETAGTFLVEVENDKVAKSLFKGIPYKIIGKTHESKSLIIESGTKTLVNTNIDLLKHIWQKPMKEIFH